MPISVYYSYFKNPFLIRFALSILFSFLITSSYGQHLFPEKFKGCNTDQFSLESDSVTAKINSQTLVSLITSSLTEDQVETATGTLSLQIIVEKNGESCLLSLKNDTNLKTKQLHLKENIDGKLHWEKVGDKVAAVVVLRFSSGAISIKRLGMNGKRGVHELRP
jgi:hypothetical protein